MEGANNNLNTIMSKVLKPTKLKRVLFFLLSDVFIIGFSLYMSFLVRFDFDLKPEYTLMVLKGAGAFIIVKILVFLFFRLYFMTWGNVGLNDLLTIAMATIVSQSVLMVLILIPPPDIVQNIMDVHIIGFPRSIFLIDWLISFVLIAGVRISKRIVLEVLREKTNHGSGKRTVIIGAGHTGEMIIRDITRQSYKEFCPVAILDDNPDKTGTYIRGIKVCGRLSDLPEVIKEKNIEAVIIAIPSLNYRTLRSIYETAQKSGIQTIKIVPRIYDYRKPEVSVKQLSDISIEDLLGRQPVHVNDEEIERFIKNKRIIVTGAGGSIGAELATQVAGYRPSLLVLLDNDETWVHNMKLRLNRLFPESASRIKCIVGDIRFRDRIAQVFEHFNPEIVFHSAAYKHVSMMEFNASEAIQVNVMGTYILSSVSVKHGVKKFVQISTDKAVRPTSIMGATKRLAEHVCTAFNNLGRTEFVSVRFGNVLGSRGSVLPLFLEQLKHGGPLTVTHKDMKRYFMTIPEAVTLVLQASVIGKGGEVMVLDMGKPIRIVQLAEDLIRIHGLEPYKDIKIEFIGVRPGEKMFEEILTAEEGVTATHHQKVFIAKNSEKYSLYEIENIINGLTELLDCVTIDDERYRIKNFLKRYIPHYTEEEPPVPDGASTSPTE